MERLRVAIVSNGFADGPAQALRDFLVDGGASVTTVFHPLVPEGGRRHEIAVYEGGRQRAERRIALPLRPPVSFLLDPIVPLRMPAVDLWFGFNCLCAARGLVARRLRRATKVVYWCVDFVPDRFGRSPLTRVYDGLDATCCRRADARFELSAEASAARDARHHLAREAVAPVRVVPMGAWTQRTPAVSTDGWRRRHVVFLGHLVERQGVGLFLDALTELRARDAQVTATVVGGGPLEHELREQARRLGLEGVVTFFGFVEDHREVERTLAEASLAVAPYEPSPDTFSRYADPGKLKAYVAAGLPVLLTDVPPNAGTLAREAGAEIVGYDATALATAIERALDDGEEWTRRRASALRYAATFDWNHLLTDALDSVWP